MLTIYVCLLIISSSKLTSPHGLWAEWYGTRVAEDAQEKLIKISANVVSHPPRRAATHLEPLVRPHGAVIVKHSLSINNRGEVLPGRLIVMEKMEPVFDPERGDWRFIAILPDGSILGATKGENAQNVAFCVPCHEYAGDGRDYLFVPPKAFRRMF